MTTIENLVWEQKYRPKTVDNCILPEATKKMIKDSIESGNIPNFLFSGPGGVGKTTLARAIGVELNADVLFINSSLNGNIDTLRTTITQFVSTVSFSGGKKIVLLDEFDYITQATQPAMRGFLDEFSTNAIFILTCNFKNRIIDPLISRLTVVDFKFSKEEKKSAGMQMMKRCINILEEEKINFERAAVAALVTKNFPDFRKTLVELQKYSASGSIDSGILAISEETTLVELIQAMKSKDFNKCRQWIANNASDSTAFYRLFYDRVIPDLVPQTVPPVILVLAESQFRASHSVDQEINMTACIIQLLQTAQFK